jgi:hypothetical protein
VTFAAMIGRRRHAGYLSGDGGTGPLRVVADQRASNDLFEGGEGRLDF